LVDARELMGEMGIHVETCANEAAAAAMLGASINYPLRGAVTWKSIVGTNVAADGLSNLSSPGVIGGTLIVVGEDYGEGASVIQERTLAMAMKSGIWLLDPRPDLPSIVGMVEHAFALSEASSAPVMMQLRVRACHVQGSFTAKDNVAPTVNTHARLAEPAAFDYARLAHPPVTFAQEKLKVEKRLPAALAYIREHGLNEVFDGDIGSIGVILQGGLYNTAIRRLRALGLADAFGESRIPLLVLNVVHPLVPDQIEAFCAEKDAVLVQEEGNPEYIEQQISMILHRAGIQTRIHGKGLMPAAGEYTAQAIGDGLAAFLEATMPPGVDMAAVARARNATQTAREGGEAALPIALPPRPPSLCTGCPERPVFSAIKILEREVGRVHI
ncbi:MAG: indolepyruvate ferredoxin oxidoreductase subunit alpha, partial [Alphaproteobacteria bacterium]|nr:indolepyruvate ferredoxin oxidoreductase subunit alpha [Alphaproteobacteria bacterium]